MGVFELERIHTLHGLALRVLGPGQTLNDVYAD